MIRIGIDPESRHQVWKIIDSVKQSGNQSIVVTTHSMEEADALCTRIGILAGGNLQCIGTQTRLKKKFGQGGVRLNLVAKIVKTDFNYETYNDIPDKEMIKYETSILSQVKEYLLVHVPNAVAQIESGVGSQVRSNGVMDKKVGTTSWCMHASINLLNVDVIQLIKCVADLKQFGIVEFAINPSSLEDIFIKLTENYTENE